MHRIREYYLRFFLCKFDTVRFVSIYTIRYHNTNREQTFHSRPKWALVLTFFASGTRETFSPGWSHQPGLKVSAQRLLRQTEVAGTISPGWSHQPGLKVSLVPGAKNSGTRAHFGRGSKVCSLLVAT